VNVMETKVKERPMLFADRLVRGLLDGSKTQTRRPVKGLPMVDGECVYGKLCGPEWYQPTIVGRDGEEREGKPIFGIYAEDGEWGMECPWTPGDRIWPQTGYTTRYDKQFNKTYWSAAGTFITTHGQATSKTGRAKRDGGHPARFMPHWLSSELQLPEMEITDIRVERLQDITEADARAEGIKDGGCLHCGRPEPCGCPNPQPDARDAFVYGWNEHYAATDFNWMANPYVWVIDFKRLTPTPAATPSPEKGE
jgi:hypothetical protein